MAVFTPVCAQAAFLETGSDCHSSCLLLAASIEVWRVDMFQLFVVPKIMR